jgi:hypothetical protein
MKTPNPLLALLAVIAFCLLIPQIAYTQTENLGIVSYVAPQGWTKTPKQNIVAFSEVNQSKGSFCIITLYGATPSSGNPTSDFTREWNNLAVNNLKAEAAPQTETQEAEGWTIIAAASGVDSGGIKGVAFLTVISGFGKTVSVLAVFNSETYMGQISSFISQINLEKSVAPANNTSGKSSPTFDDRGHLIVPLPTRQLTVADLAGNWGQDTSHMVTNYYNRSTGASAGTDFKSYQYKMTITEDGGFLDDYVGIENGKKILQNLNGAVSVEGRVFTINHNGRRTKYVIRGWLELPEMTIFVIIGPWVNDDPIPDEFFTTDKGYEATWVRSN